MTNQEILTKAIQKAIDGEWRGIKPALWGRIYNWGIDVSEDSRIAKYWCNWKFFDSSEFAERDIEAVIFNHDFAKALWGGSVEYLQAENWRSDDGCATAEFVGPIWQYHLQQMVIADDPIKYLGEHLNDSPSS